VFDDPALAVCDERPWIEAVAQRAGLPVHTLTADDAWPLAASGCLGRVGEPPANPYRALKQRLYAAAREQGVSVLLAGAGGDLLWTGGRRGWLADLLAEGRLGTAGAEVAAALVTRRFGGLRAAAAGLLPPRRRNAERPWLRPETAGRVAAGDAAPITSTADWRRRNLTGAVAARGFSGEAAWARRAGIELRDPFRDRRVVELALAAPAHLLHRRGEDKVLLRRALADLLPETVLRRRGSAPLGPLFRRGVAERERSRVETLLSRGELWRRHVDESWMQRALDELSRGALRGAAAVALWRAVAVEHWLLVRDTGRAAPPRPADALLGAGGGR
jgi:asparagine synthase (glutamine-hydrolysing)